MNNNMQTPINGIKCDVSNCHYHRNGGKCVAGEIKVGPQYADSSDGTVCDTFIPESYDAGSM